MDVYIDVLILILIQGLDTTLVQIFFKQYLSRSGEVALDDNVESGGLIHRFGDIQIIVFFVKFRMNNANFR